MFVGRSEELKTLERLYRRGGFQMIVLYGRRRIGKTTLLEEFVKDKHAVFFTAKVQSSRLNLHDFSRTLHQALELPASTGDFAAWSDAFSFIAEYAGKRSEPLVVVFDEFPYAAESDPSLPSVLQVAIDHELKKTNCYLILCGSNEGFMESDVLGRKSPLYGRRTAQLRLLPFDYHEAACMLSNRSPEESVTFYATFGGTPYYLEQIDPALSYEENVEALFFDKSGILYEEPSMFLRQELREPALYNSALYAVANGASVPKEIAEKAGIDQNAVGRYLRILEDLGLISRVVPFGENATRSRKGRYVLNDPFFSFWYRFVNPAIGNIEAGVGSSAARKTVFGDNLSTYVGRWFEAICLQWLLRENRKGDLPFLASHFGQWWGSDPVAREQTDIDIVVASPQDKAIILGECKWRNTFNETDAMAKLAAKTTLLPDYDSYWFYLFSKNPVSEATRIKAQDQRFTCVSTADLFA